MAASGGINSLVKLLRNAVSGNVTSKKITADNALYYPPVWYCVSKITGAFMIMPLNLHRSIGRERSIQDSHQAYSLMRWRPNNMQSPSQWKRQMMLHALLWGNARSYIRRERGVPVELIPLMPDRTVTIMKDGLKFHSTIIERDDRLSLFYDIGNNPEKAFLFPDADVWHVPGLGFDGIEGQSLISIAAQSWGIGLDLQQQVASQTKKGYAGGLMLEAPVGAFRNEADAKEFLKAFRESHEGTESAGKIGMLREGIKANVMAMSNSDAQFLEQRRFQREDTALLFCLEGILGDSSNASYNSLAEKNLAYRQNCLAPWTTAWEEESELKLLTQAERNSGYYYKFNDGSLLRTEKSLTMAYISQAIACRVMSPNEGRELIDMNPYDGGDVYANPAITPAATDVPPPADQPTNTALHERAVSAMLSNLLSVEANRCRDMAKNAATFLKKIEAWYAGFEATLADRIDELGGDRALATDHCDESMKRLLVATECQPEQLAESVTACVETWPNRVNLLVERILSNVAC